LNGHNKLEMNIEVNQNIKKYGYLDLMNNSIMQEIVLNLKF
jgi:hypothetical protein